MCSDTTWILGASDPEMERIEALLRACGQRVLYAAIEGRRVRPHEAYRADGVIGEGDPEGGILVECAVVGVTARSRCDHHRPCDAGYGRLPESFLPASSIGQVIAKLARMGALSEHARRAPGWVRVESDFRETTGIYRLLRDRGRWAVADEPWMFLTIPEGLVLAAAADHCLAAAYAGRCPGVARDALYRWRAETRAAHQGRPVEDVRADVEAARTALLSCPLVRLGGSVVSDLRARFVPELPEAGAIEGRAYLASPPVRRGEPRKVVLGAAAPEVVRAFLAGEGAAAGLVRRYGDPARGFAGGYVEEGR